MGSAGLSRDRESRRLPRVALSVVAALVAAFAVGACTSQQADSARDEGPPDSSVAQESGTPSPDAPTPGTPSPDAPPPSTTSPAPIPCQPNLADKVEQIVRGQNVAINQRDYAKALEYSSSRYRSGTTPELFGLMIEGAYQYLLDPGEYPLFNCYVYDGPPRQVVTITAEFGETLMAYYLVKEESQWRIDLAGGTGAARRQQPAV